MDDFIVAKGVAFQKCNEWELQLNTGDLVTPIWSRNKCVRLLITRAKTGKSLFVEADAHCLNIAISVNTYKLPQGITYLLNDDCRLSVLTTMISFIKNKEV